MFGKDEIENLRKVYNSEHPKEIPIEAGDSADVWKNLRARFHSKCRAGRSECVIAHMINRPKAPDAWINNPTEWLSSTDIESVEKQFEKLFPHYVFLGCIPIDFDLKSETGKCLVDALCSTNLRELYRKGKTQIGIVFNTDVSTGPGEHWISLFCDIRPELETPRVTYFDSYSRKPEAQIQKLMKRWRDEWATTGVHDNEMDTTYNTTRHQFKDTECGMYSLLFHYACLIQLPLGEKIPDAVVESFRHLFFSRRK